MPACLRRCFLILLAVLLTGCGEHYPDNWPAPETRWHGCPDLTGQYSNPDTSRGHISLLTQGVLYEAFNASSIDYPWASLNLQGDAEKRLQATLTRTPATLQDWLEDHGQRQRPVSDSQNAMALWRWSDSRRTATQAELPLYLAQTGLPLQRQLRLLAGGDYHCDSGWLVGRRFLTDAQGNLQPVEGELRLARDKDGGLLIHAVIEDTRHGLFCLRGHCLPVPLGASSRHEWERWPARASSHEEEPWNQPFSVAPSPYRLVRAHDASQRLDETRQALAGLGVNGLQISATHASEDGGSVLVTLSAPQTDSFALLFRALQAQKSPLFHSPEILGVSHEGSNWQMQLLLGLPPRASNSSSVSIAQTLRPLLPDALHLQSVEPDEDGFRVVIGGDGLDDATLHGVLPLVRNSGQFRDVRLQTYVMAGDHSEVVLKVWENTP